MSPGTDAKGSRSLSHSEWFGMRESRDRPPSRLKGVKLSGYAKQALVLAPCPGYSGGVAGRVVEFSSQRKKLEPTPATLVAVRSPPMSLASR